MVLILAVMLALAAGFPVHAADYSLLMEFSSVDQALLASMAGTAPVVPRDDHVLIVGRMDHPALSIAAVNRITVESPRGERLPLIIDGAGVMREFGEIVALNFGFELPRADAAAGGDGYRIVWGREVDAANDTVNRLALDAGASERYRQFRWKEIMARDADADAAPVSTIVVIADSTAEYHFLWYLLPMGLLFTVLTIRKIRAHHSSD